MNALISYIRGVRAEIPHIVWPSRRRAIADVIAVVLISAIAAAVIGGLDYIFTGAVNYFISNQP